MTQQEPPSPRQAVSTIESSGQIPYLSTNATSASFTLSAGRTTTEPSNKFLLGGAGSDSNSRSRCIELTPYGAGTATTTFDYRVYVGKRCYRNIAGVGDCWELLLFCSGTATLGATAGVGTYGPKSTDKICDAVTCAASAYASAVCAAYNAPTPSAFSPGGGASAKVFIPDCGNAEFIVIDFDMTGATSGNFLIERGT